MMTETEYELLLAQDQALWREYLEARKRTREKELAWEAVADRLQAEQKRRSEAKSGAGEGIAV